MELVAANEDPAERWLVYLMACQRGRPYIIGVGRDIEQIGYDCFEHKSRIMWLANRYSRDPFLLMWYEAATGRDQALTRAAQIRRWPHAWQRRLVETSNPQWLEQWKREIGVSPLLWGYVPEISPRASRPRAFDPARSRQQTRATSHLRLVARTCANPESIPSCPPPSARPLRRDRQRENVHIRNFSVPVFLSALLITFGASCYFAFA
jgi:predicted GIY-YIG superfamily endonuclease